MHNSGASLICELVIEIMHSIQLRSSPVANPWRALLALSVGAGIPSVFCRLSRAPCLQSSFSTFRAFSADPKATYQALPCAAESLFSQVSSLSIQRSSDWPTAGNRTRDAALSCEATLLSQYCSRTASLKEPPVAARALADGHFS